MRILYVATYSGTSGANHSLINMILQMKKKGIETTLIIPKSGPIEELLYKNNIKYTKIKQFHWVTSINTSPSLINYIKRSVKQVINFVQEFRISYIIKRNKIDLVHINAITASNGYLASKMSTIPLVWHVREFLEEDLNQKFSNKKKAINRLNKSDCIITVSDSVKSKYEKTLHNSNLIRIYNGIDQFIYKGVKNNLFEKEKVVLTLAGRYVSQKGHLELIYALEKVVKNYNKVIVKFYGIENNQIFITELKHLVEELKLDKYIEFNGYRSDMHNVWSETDIAVVASKAEAFGRVTVEAMLAGALVIGADTAGTAELISDKYGLLYNQGDHISLAEKILYAIDNQEEMKKTACLGKDYASKHFTAENNADNIQQVYKKLLD